MNYFKILSLLLLIQLTPHQSAAQVTNFLRFVSDTVIHLSEYSSLVQLEFEIRQGYHIQSHNPASDNVIPTEIEIDWPRAITPFDPIFPEPVEIVLEGTDEPLQVFKDELLVTIAIEINQDIITGKYRIPGQIRYQACDHKQCFFPRVLHFSINLRVD